jgi:uncharacterized membrane protein YjjP (DUF1212 family)
MHGEDYVCLGFLFGRKARVAYLSDVSRILLRTEQGMNIVSPSFFIQLTESFFTVCMIIYTVQVNEIEEDVCQRTKVDSQSTLK